ncbi:MAG: 50S ribosomal protein L23 [Gammaproteobacteria bacterium]|nr:50S ribosomal protein L23 [Gammaproteobacteria bacterium]MBA3730938.1 50S ribosomal protein L23 [Gammaproteobacteria bacterium]
MSQERLMKVLLAPHVSEKSTLAADSARQHVFKVLPDATKSEVKHAVEMLFSVQVMQVRMLNVKGKLKRHGARRGRRSDWKKAYVQLAPGNDISLGPE